jgi:hypothetical protein
MQKFLRAAVAAAFLGGAALVPYQASAHYYPPTPPPGGGGGAGGSGLAVGIIGLVTFLVVYDITRRTTCVGDWLHLGGPGFDSKITAGMNVLPPPACGTHKKKKKKINVISVKG